MSVSKYFTIAYLLTKPAILGIVGNRIYPRNLPVSGVLPAVVVRKASESREVRLDGDAKVSRTVLEVYCMASTDAEMEALKEEIITALHGQIVASEGASANFVLLNDADVEDDLEEVALTGVLEFDIIWQY